MTDCRGAVRLPSSTASLFTRLVGLNLVSSAEFAFEVVLEAESSKETAATLKMQMMKKITTIFFLMFLTLCARLHYVSPELPICLSSSGYWCTNPPMQLFTPRGCL